MNQNPKCWEIKNCPAGNYLLCPAYALNKNCWEVPGTRCQESHNQSDCENCDIYLVRNLEKRYASHK